MPERIYKLQPNRTLALRGFDDLGASAALHSATPDSFKVSGVFRDPADFAVLMLHDADNFYEHPRLRHLPDFDFTGLTLTFDVRYEGLMPLDSPKYATIDWPFLDVLRPNGSNARIRLFDYATKLSGDYVKAQTEFVVVDGGLKEFDRLTVWYLNAAYDYIVPKVECAYAFFAGTPGTQHTVTVAGTPYTYVEQSGDTSAAVASGVALALAASPDVSAATGDGSPENGPAHQVNIRAKKTDGAGFNVTFGTTTNQLFGVGASTVAAALAAQINSTNWNATGALIPLSATTAGATLRITADRPGYDGNMLTMYAVAKNERLKTQSPTAAFIGGSSDATWRVTIDFSALNIPQARLMWLTFSPQLANGAAFTSLEWQATFTNWTLAGPETSRVLKVAGPGSVRIEENDSWCTFSGSWGLETGFFSEGYAKHAASVGDAVTIKYACSHAHDLYVGTSLYIDRGIAGVRLDNDTETDLDCMLQTDAMVNTRRKLRSSVPAGEHTCVIRLKSGQHVYFDFLEAAVVSDVPDPLPSRAGLSPAMDYSTDHTYKLSPARIHWMFDNLGYSGPMNEYIGVFWWNQRVRSGAAIPEVRVQFSGGFAAGDQIFVNIGGQPAGKTVFANETNETIARHFSCFINANYVGVWASANGSELIVTSRSPKPAYAFTFSASKDPSQSSGAVSVTGSLQNGQPGKWMVDPSQSQALNRGARDWHSDMFRECAARNREIVVATSMELVNPPDEFAARFANGQAVETSVGFGSINSTHCAFVNPMREYQKSVYKSLADLMAGAGATPHLQFGEFLWWFFTNGSMAFYDAETKAAAAAALGRPLHVFAAPTDDPTVNSSADANFLRNRLRDHVAALIAHVRTAHPQAKFELLFPYDVNHPSPAGIHQLGGPLNRYINFPVEWEQKTTSGFDRLKMEALDFGAWSRNLDLARTAIRFPIDLGWPKDSIRHLVPIFRPGYPWDKEIDLATSDGIPIVNLWAYDHICIYGWPVAEPSKGRSIRF